MSEKLLRLVTMLRVECNSYAWEYAQAAASYFYGLADGAADFFGDIRGVLRHVDVMFDLIQSGSMKYTPSVRLKNPT